MAKFSVKQEVGYDGVPVMRGLARMLSDARHNGWDGTLTSADRREGRPEKYGRLSQARLYAAWIAWSTKRVLIRPFTRSNPPNPANPPGFSTHELRSDAVVYKGPKGRPLAWWQLGMDTTNPDELRVVLNRLGYIPFRPYATESERHHTNLRSSPYKRLKQRGMIPQPKAVGRGRKVHDPSKLDLSAAGLQLIAKFEGFVDHPYNDPAPGGGHATIGYGHLIHRGPVTPADTAKWGTITRERARGMLRTDLIGRVEAVRQLLKVKVTQGEFDALVSFGFNVGLGALADSVLLQKLNTKDRKGAAAEFDKWVKADGKILPGLVVRRNEEEDTFRKRVVAFDPAHREAMPVPPAAREAFVER